MSYGYIYSVENLVNGKKYIGQTTRSLEKRKKEHLKDNNGSVLHYALDKYGPDNFEWKIIDTAKNSKELNLLERQYIKDQKTLVYENGYNIHEGGEVYYQKNKSKPKAINSYKRLEEIIVKVLRDQNKPISASRIRNIIHDKYRIGRIDTNPRSIAQRIKFHPEISSIHDGRMNYYYL